MRSRSLVLVFGSLALLASSPAWAQERQGFWIGFGLGYGSAYASCDQCVEGDGEGSLTGSLKLGGTLNPHVLLGVEINGWTKDVNDTNLTLGSFTGTVTFYPGETSGFFLKGGVGVSYVDTDFREGSFSASVSKAGLGGLAGIGYDLRVGGNVSLTPSFNFYFGKPGDISLNGETVLSNWKQHVFDFGIGITFH
jgi:hypothetical protein